MNNSVMKNLINKLFKYFGYEPIQYHIGLGNKSYHIIKEECFEWQPIIGDVIIPRSEIYNMGKDNAVKHAKRAITTELIETMARMVEWEVYEDDRFQFHISMKVFIGKKK